jgi:SAM-dependent methyltransferase
MHYKMFLGAYIKSNNASLLEVGSQNINGSLREITPPDIKYIGADMIAGQGVDLLMKDPYTIPVETGTLDVVVSSSCLEHVEFFWVLFLEMLRVLKPDGLLYINVPTNGFYHRFPFDYWRFYPDSGLALER